MRSRQRRRQRSPWGGPAAPSRTIVVPLMLLLLGLILDGMGLKHGDKLVFVGLLLLLVGAIADVVKHSD